jgi:hypothetical protein
MMTQSSRYFGSLVLFAVLPQLLGCGNEILGPGAAFTQGPVNAAGEETLILLPGNADLRIGQFLGLKPCWQDGDETYMDPGKNIRWLSDSPGIASVNQEGLVLGLREGTARIRVEVGREAAEVSVTVKES